MIDNSQIVLANTAPNGRQQINERVSSLRGEWNELLAALTARESRLEGVLGQWALYDTSLDRLEAWLTGTEDAVKPHQSAQVATLTEKRAQLDQLKV